MTQCDNATILRCQPGEVRVAIRAAGISFVDVLTAAGNYQVKPPLPFIPGSEAAGVIIELCREVGELAPPIWGLRLMIGAVVVYAVGWKTVLDAVLHLKTTLLERVAAAGPLVFFGAMAVLPSVGVPNSPFALAAGPVFGERLGLPVRVARTSSASWA